MPLGRFLTHRVSVWRRSYDEETLDEQGQPAESTALLAGDQPAAIVPKRQQEVALSHQAGVAYGTHLLYLYPQDLRTSDYIEHDATACPEPSDLPSGTYEIVAVPLSAGVAHHIEAEVRQVQSIGAAMAPSGS